MATFVAIAITTCTYAAASDKAVAAYLKIKTPDNNERVRANTALLASGTSAPSNATRAKCSVQLQIDQQGYNQTDPKGPTNQLFTVWSHLVPAKALTPGQHSAEGQLTCLTPGTHTVNFVKHLVHNFTALNGPIPIPTSSSSSASKGQSATVGKPLPPTIP